MNLPMGQPVPDLPPPLVPATESAVAADLRADAAGEPRSEDPPPPPPWTVKEKWWQSRAVHLAIFLVFMRILGYVEKVFPMRAEEVLLGKDIVTIVAGAFGITALTAAKLRRKE